MLIYRRVCCPILSSFHGRSPYHTGTIPLAARLCLKPHCHLPTTCETLWGTRGGHPEKIRQGLSKGFPRKWVQWASFCCQNSFRLQNWKPNPMQSLSQSTSLGGLQVDASCPPPLASCKPVKCLFKHVAHPEEKQP